MDKYWDTSIDELMSVFRDTLSALFRPLRKAQIPIGICAGGDSWSVISKTIFDQIVVEAIYYSMDINEVDFLKMPKYELNYFTYCDLSFIKVVCIGEEEGGFIRVFHSFVEPDDIDVDIEMPAIRCVKINELGEILDTEYDILLYRNVKFVLYFKGLQVREISNLHVLL